MDSLITALLSLLCNRLLLTATVTAEILPETKNETLNTSSQEVFDVFPFTKLVQTTTPFPPQPLPEIVMTIIIIGGCVMLGVLISKAADFFYDYHIRKNIKLEMSENTRKLLKARITILRFRADPKAEQLKLVKRFAIKWMEKTVSRKVTVVQNKSMQQPSEAIKEELISIDQLPEKLEDSNKTLNKDVIVNIPNPQSLPSPGNTEVEQAAYLVEKLPSSLKPNGRLPPVVVNDAPQKTSLS